MPARVEGRGQLDRRWRVHMPVVVAHGGQQVSDVVVMQLVADMTAVAAGVNETQ